MWGLTALSEKVKTCTPDSCVTTIWPQVRSISVEHVGMIMILLEVIVIIMMKAALSNLHVLGIILLSKLCALDTPLVL